MNIHGYKKGKKRLVETLRSKIKLYESIENSKKYKDNVKKKILNRLSNKINHLRKAIIDCNKIIKELKQAKLKAKIK